MQFSYRTYLFAGAATALIAGAGLVHGYWTDRWSASVETQEAAERLHTLPLRVGDWEGEEVATRPGQGGPGVAGCIQRRYTNRSRGVTVVVALVCGRPGPVATHTPEVCYGASGYLVGDKKSVSLEGQEQPARFWWSDAVKTSKTDEAKVRIFWAWNAGQGWVASRDARNEFPRTRYPVLHKLYVLRDLSAGPGEQEAGKDEPCQAFLQELVPAMQETLFAGP